MRKPITTLVKATTIWLRPSMPRHSARSKRRDVELLKCRVDFAVQISLKFIQTGAANTAAKRALKTYLLAKLEKLKAEVRATHAISISISILNLCHACTSPQDLTQQTMICTWLTEIFLDTLNSLQSPAATMLQNAKANAGDSKDGDGGISYPADPLIPVRSHDKQRSAELSCLFAVRSNCRPRIASSCARSRRSSASSSTPTQTA